jgi:hypothetical protein
MVAKADFSCHFPLDLYPAEGLRSGWIEPFALLAAPTPTRYPPGSEVLLLAPFWFTSADAVD